MKKWWKIIIGLLIIAAALYVMYMWNEKGREKLQEAEAEIETVISPVPEKTAKEIALEQDKSFFPIPYDWVMTHSSQIVVGDFVGIYAEETNGQDAAETDDKDEAPAEEIKDVTKLGCFEVAVVSEGSLEIVCDLDEYMKIKNVVNTQEANLILVMEDAVE